MLISKHIKLFTSAFLAAMALSSCLNLDETTDGAYGYLTIAGMDVNLQVDQLVATKADEATVNISEIAGYAPPELSSVTVVNNDGSGKTYTWNNGETLSLPAGTYTLSATCGTNGFGAPCFEGKGEVQVTAGATATGTVSFTLANSVMKVTNAMPEHFEPSEGNCVTLLSDDSTLEPQSVTTAMDTYAFVPAGKSLKVKVQGKSTAGGNQKPFECPLNKATEKAKAYNVTLSANGVTLPEISLSSKQVAWGDRIFITTPATGEILANVSGTVIYEAIPVASTDWTESKEAVGNVITGLTPGSEYKVRARIGGLVSSAITLKPEVKGISSQTYHTDSNGDVEGGDLDGTDVETTFSGQPSVVIDAIQAWSYKLYDSNKTLLREYSDADADGSVISDGSLLTDTADWPYLPQGTYTLVSAVTMKGGKTLSYEENINVDAPVFTPTVFLGNTSYTSYDKYTGNTAEGIAKNVDDANTCAPETLYKPSAIIGGISENLIKNSNYIKTITFLVDDVVWRTYEEKGMSNNTKIGANIESLSWGSHVLAATFTFAGITKTSNSKTHRITGLPYKSPDFTTQSPELTNSNEANKWISQGTTSYNEDRGFQIYYFYNYLFGETSSSGNVFSPAFQIPQNESVNISYVVGINFYTSGLGTGQTVDIYTGPTNNLEKVKTKTTTVSRGESYSDKITNITSNQDSAVLNTRISISHNDPSLSNNRAENWVLITGLQVNYR